MAFLDGMPHRRIGTFGGVPIIVDITYPIMVVMILIETSWLSHWGMAAYVKLKTVQIVGIFASILLHEIGHAVAARRFGVGTEMLWIGGFYGLAFIKPHRLPPLQRIAILAAGPFANLLICLWLWGLLGFPTFHRASVLTRTALQSDPILWSAVFWLAKVNLILVVINLLPGFPTDGGRISRLVLRRFIPDDQVVRGIAITGCIIGVWCFFGPRPFGVTLETFGMFLLFNNLALLKGSAPPD